MDVNWTNAVDLTRPIVPVIDGSEEQWAEISAVGRVRAFYLTDATTRPVKAGSFVGDTRRGVCDGWGGGA